MGNIFGKRRSLLIERRERKGYLYIAPFVIGFFLFIFYPMLQSLIYSFSDVVFDGKLNLNFAGLVNYKRAFLEDTEYRKLLINSVTDMVVNVPIILIFSMLVAIFLNGEFPGKAFFQIAFFIPVIVSAGILPGLFGSDMVSRTIINAASTTGEANSTFDISAMSEMLKNMSLPAEFIDYIMYAINNILSIINYSGIQILVLLMALKSIPKSLYEASDIEGATAWEGFWKITFPMVLPQMVVCLTYTIIDSFTNNVSPVMNSIKDYNFSKFQFGYAASLSWSYFIIIIAILAIFVGILNLLMRRYE